MGCLLWRRSVLIQKLGRENSPLVCLFGIPGKFLLKKIPERPRPHGCIGIWLDVDDEIRVSKSLPLGGLTAAALADEMVSAVEAARSLARSLELFSEADDVRQEEAEGSGALPASTMPSPIQFA